MKQLKITTWNINSLRVRLPQVLDWLKVHQPDVLALQETKVVNDKFPQEAFAKIGYHAWYSGQKTYNGVAILSREELQNIITDLPNLEDPQRRILGATLGDIRLLNLYVPNGGDLESEKYSYKLNWLERVKDYLQKSLVKYPRFIVLGDFNIAPEDQDVYDPEIWYENILCSTRERKALKNILNLGFYDSFRLFDQEQMSFSWWNYRQGAFRRNHGLRIDLILISKDLISNCKKAVIDKEPRRLKQPSDHAPMTSFFT
ncbi:exodeoxyribonuclease III [Candidatus Nitrosoglobus terrae]|uniref:Exodeoxyribonuclease III n=1 Tax=Candidatus Nitrosoglobus terrae TaxID=1630141 RepID=A0A1Q2SL55_9GAMM|nr:exodeoxyribonuclease III [Candidatus Nitrosoglobus terrae]BAW79876.1 exodeoxyribonuclease III [Candidatus Nitrosoglobus terrae]